MGCFEKSKFDKIKLFAMQHGQKEIIKYLISKKHSILKDKAGRTALHWVALYMNGGIFFNTSFLFVFYNQLFY